MVDYELFNEFQLAGKYNYPILYLLSQRYILKAIRKYAYAFQVVFKVHGLSLNWAALTAYRQTGRRTW